MASLFRLQSRDVARLTLEGQLRGTTLLQQASTEDQSQNPAAFIGPVVTDSLLVQSIQYHLLENATQQVDGTTWVGTEMFTLASVTAAMQRALNQFLQDTGCQISPFQQPGPTPPNDLVNLPQTVIDVRRAAWIVYSFNPAVLIAPTVTDSGDHQNFTVSLSPVFGQYNQAFVNGQLLAYPQSFTLSGLNLALTVALSGIWDLQFFIGSGTFVNPVDSGNHQDFYIPLPPGPTYTLQVFVNGQLKDPGYHTVPDYTLSPGELSFTYGLGNPRYWNLQAFWTEAQAITPVDSGDHQNFTLPFSPSNSLQLFNEGQVLEPGAGKIMSCRGVLSPPRTLTPQAPSTFKPLR